MAVKEIQKTLSPEVKKQILANRKHLTTAIDKERIIEAWRLGADAKLIRNLNISSLSVYHIKKIIEESGETNNLGIDAEETNVKK